MNEFKPQDVETTIPTGREAQWGLSEGERGELFSCLHTENLAALVVATGRAGDMSRDRGAALGASFEQGCDPAICVLTHFLLGL